MTCQRGYSQEPSRCHSVIVAHQIFHLCLQATICERKLTEQTRQAQDVRRTFGARLAKEVARAAQVGQVKICLQLSLSLPFGFLPLFENDNIKLQYPPIVFGIFNVESD